MRAPRLLVLLPCVLLLAACGLETITAVLNPPAQGVTGPDYFQFEKTTTDTEPHSDPPTDDNVEREFSGFELYYRFYNFADTPDLVDTHEELAAMGYRRVYAPTDSSGLISWPLIKVALADRDQAFTVTIDFAGMSISNVQPPALSENILIEDFRRAVARPFPDEDEFRSFSEFDSDGADADLKGLDWEDFQLLGQLSLYVLSYGLDIPLNKRLYSQPIWLGTITKAFVQ